MRILFLGEDHNLNPWHDDFVEAVVGRWPIARHDPARPPEEQLRGVGVVVEIGGSLGTRHLIDAAVAAEVRLWQILGTGLDHVDVAYFTERGLPLANTPGQFSAVGLAEHALFLMLCFAKHLNAGQRNVRSRVLWQPFSEELEGQTLGLVGFGASARELAKRAAPFGMRLAAIDTVPPAAGTLAQYGVEYLGGPDQLESLASAADYLSIHVPLIPATRHLIDEHVLALMKPTAVLINVARGAIVDEAALIAALRHGRIRGAGLDVFAQEPIEPDHPLLALENVIATPHVAGVTLGTSRRRGQAAAENVARVARGEDPLYLATTIG
jgi:D-3-phosphoglycerate dehydrogenase / 2-oxoglutarate reductase